SKSSLTSYGSGLTSASSRSQGVVWVEPPDALKPPPLEVPPVPGTSPSPSPEVPPRLSSGEDGSSLLQACALTNVQTAAVPTVTQVVTFIFVLAPSGWYVRK